MRVMTKLLTILMTVALMAPAFAQGQNNPGVVTPEGRSLQDFKMLISRQTTRQNLRNKGQLMRQRSSIMAFTNVAQNLNRRGNLLRQWRGTLLNANINNNRVINPNWKQTPTLRNQMRKMETYRLQQGRQMAQVRLFTNRPSRFSLRAGQRSRVFLTPERRPFPKAEPHVIPEESHVKNGLAMYVQAKSHDGMLQVPDRMANEYWNAWMVSHPTIKKVGRDYVAQAGFYGTLGDDPTVHPLVVDFRLKGDDKSWHVRDINVASVNRVPREGVAQLMRFVPTATGQLGVEEVRTDS